MSSNTPGNISSNTPGNLDRISILIARDAWNSFIYDDPQRAHKLAPQALAQPNLPDVLKAPMHTIMATPIRHKESSRLLGSKMQRRWRKIMFQSRLLEQEREHHSALNEALNERLNESLNERSIPGHETYFPFDPTFLSSETLDQRTLSEFGLEDVRLNDSDKNEFDFADETEDEREFQVEQSIEVGDRDTANGGSARLGPQGLNAWLTVNPHFDDESPVAEFNEERTSLADHPLRNLSLTELLGLDD